MTTEEKIDQIHDAVITIQVELKAKDKFCSEQHKNIDERLHGLHRVIKGNGSKGLEQKHQDLSDSFIGMKATVFAYSTVGSIIGGGIMTIVMAVLVKHFTK